MARLNLIRSIMDDCWHPSPATCSTTCRKNPNGNAIHVERILLEMVRPDRYSRRVLPESIHLRFHQNQITPTQALRELVQIVQIAARHRGRPFNNLLELLPNAEDERDDEPTATLTPEEVFLRDLVNLAITLRDDGQVNPLTVVDVSQGVTRLFRIETGERRYWATWLLRDFIPNYTGDGMIPCIVIPVNRSSIFRQAKENTARSGLTAVALARQAALLLLTVHGYEIPAYAVENDFYRQALELDLRSKREYTDVVLSAMGGIKRGQFSYIKGLLRLSDEALELADRHAIEEGRLRYVTNVAPEYHAEIVRQIIDFNLSTKQVKELCEGDDTHDPKSDADDVSPSAIKVAKATQTVNAMTPQELARALMQQEGDASIARARLQAMRKLLSEAERYLTGD